MSEKNVSPERSHPILVLSRYIRESLVITTQCGERIVVHVSAVRGDQVRLAIDAPQGVKVLRSELEKKEEVTTRA